jgi:TRAP-type C4-dicarboxylate transport system permease small subunit
MGRRRRKSTSEGLFDVLYDLTDMYWPAGAVVGAVLTFASLWTLDWAFDQYARASTSHYLGAFIQSFGWVYFLLPLMIAALAVLFGARSYQAFTRDHRY